MRLAVMLLAAMGVVAFVTWMRLLERSREADLVMASQNGSDEPPRYSARQVIIGGGFQNSQPAYRAETEHERFLRQREVYLKLYPALGEVLQLDAKSESDLYDLLARQGMDYRGSESADAQDRVQEEKDAQLGALLGERAFRRFDAYRTMPAAGEVGRLNATLDDKHRIRGEAIWQLARLIHENSAHGGTGPVIVSSYRALPPEVEGSTRSQMLIFHAQREEHFRIQERWRRRIEAEAVSFLTPTQFEALKRSHAETSSSWRSGLEQTRAELGLPPAVPETPEDTLLGMIRRRVPIEGEIRTGLDVAVNGESVHIERTGPNRERFGFQAGSGLWVDAIATLYDDGWMELLLAYSETRRGKRRQIDQWVLIGSGSLPHDSIPEKRSGRMEYDIRPTGITVEAIKHPR